MIKKKKIKKKVEDKFVRIKALKCYDQVEEMLYAGFPCSAIADYVQVRMREYLDVSRMALTEMLNYYRRTMNDGRVVKGTLPRLFVRAEKNFSNKMKELERLEDQYKAIQYRFDILHGEERMHGRINPEVDKVNKSMLDIISRMHGIKMDLGLVGSRDLGTVTVSAERVELIKEKYGENAAKAFSNPVSRGRVLAALGAIRRAGQLNDRDGEEMDIGKRINLTDEEKESLVVDAEYTEMEKTDEDIELVDESKDGAVPNEDIDVPWPIDEEGYEEKVEALDPADIPDVEELPKVRDRAHHEVEMEPIRREPGWNLPPGPEKPSVRGNVVQRWSTKKKKK